MSTQIIETGYSVKKGQYYIITTSGRAYVSPKDIITIWYGGNSEIEALTKSLQFEEAN